MTIKVTIGESMGLLDVEGIVEALAVWEERLKKINPDIVVNVEVAR